MVIILFPLLLFLLQTPCIARLFASVAEERKMISSFFTQRYLAICSLALDKISSAIYGKADDEYEPNIQDMRDIRELMRQIDENKLILQYLSDKIDKEEQDYLRSQIKELEECLKKKHWTIK